MRTAIAWAARVRRALLVAAATGALAMGSATIATPGPPLAAAVPTEAPAAVTPGYRLQFPVDFGSHPRYRLEWWYLTGWLSTAGGEPLGFQVTFFRTRPGWNEPNPSAFAPRQILIAHCAISAPRQHRFWQDQRIRRAGLGLAQAQEGDTRVWLDDWRLERVDGRYRARIAAQDFTLDLTFLPTQPPLPEGADGFSRKGTSAAEASYYYSEPHLRVSGTVVRAAARSEVSGEAWLDHEWSSSDLAPAARGWDWAGLNLDDGGSIMAFRMRDREGRSGWSAATERHPDGSVKSFDPRQVSFTPLRRWHSILSAADYPISSLLQVGTRRLRLEPLLDDQEIDARATSGVRYWEGAVTAFESGRPVGRGYLELTGYDRPLSLR